MNCLTNTLTSWNANNLISNLTLTTSFTSAFGTNYLSDLSSNINVATTSETFTLLPVTTLASTDCTFTYEFVTPIDTSIPEVY